MQTAPLRSLPVVSGRPRTETHRLAEDNAALVEMTLRRYFAFLEGQDREDARTEGLLGLLGAAERFDPAKGTFSTFGVESIRLAVLRHVTGQNAAGIYDSLYVPQHAREAAQVIARAEACLRLELGRAPEDAEILARSGLTPSVARWGLRCHRLQPAVSLDAPLAEGADASLSDLIVDTRPAPEAALLAREGLEGWLRGLTPDQSAVLRARFVAEKTLEEIGQARGIIRERVRQIEAAALAQVRRRARAGSV